MSKAIGVLIADDHRIVRKGLRAMMDPKPDIEVIGEAADGNEAIELARTLHPDVILMDLLMPRKDGLSATREIIQENPHAHILVLTSFDDDDKVLAAIKAGAQGYLLKDSSPEELLQAIRAVYGGKASLDPAVAMKLILEINQPSDPLPAESPLTGREVETLKLIAQGLSNQEIAAELSITKRTVSAHVGAILAKLHLSNRTQAALYALKEGIASLHTHD